MRKERTAWLETCSSNGASTAESLSTAHFSME